MDVGLAAFDMDGTLTQGRLVFALADRFGLSEKVRAVQASGQEGHLQTKEIAGLFKGITRKDLEAAVESIPLAKNCEKAVAVLKEKKCRVGIISDSYTVAANLVKDRLAMDFVSANDLEFVQDKATGRVGMPLGWEKIGCFCKISVCKRYHLEEQARRCGVPIGSTMAVGDTKSDICMLQRAAIGIAFMPKDDSVAQATPNVVREPDLLKVLEFGN
jgi:phosphoserine phosphatase